MSTITADAILPLTMRHPQLMNPMSLVVYLADVDLLLRMIVDTTIDTHQVDRSHLMLGRIGKKRTFTRGDAVLLSKQLPGTMNRHHHHHLVTITDHHGIIHLRLKVDENQLSITGIPTSLLRVRRLIILLVEGIMLHASHR